MNIWLQHLGLDSSVYSSLFLPPSPNGNGFASLAGISSILFLCTYDGAGVSHNRSLRFHRYTFILGCFEMRPRTVVFE